MTSTQGIERTLSVTEQQPTEEIITLPLSEVRTDLRHNITTASADVEKAQEHAQIVEEELARVEALLAERIREIRARVANIKAATAQSIGSIARMVDLDNATAEIDRTLFTLHSKLLSKQKELQGLREQETEYDEYFTLERRRHLMTQQAMKELNTNAQAYDMMMMEHGVEGAPVIDEKRPLHTREWIRDNMLRCELEIQQLQAEIAEARKAYDECSRERTQAVADSEVNRQKVVARRDEIQLDDLPHITTRLGKQLVDDIGDILDA